MVARGQPMCCSAVLCLIEGCPYLQFFLKNMKEPPSEDFSLTPYDYVWALDEDIDLANTDVAGLLRVADRDGASINGPAFTQPGGPLQFRVQMPDEDCDYRYTNFVEVIAPLIRVPALETLLTECEGCIHDSTSWGLDQVWCGFLDHHREEVRKNAGAFWEPSYHPHRSCAVVDKTPVYHRDYLVL